MKLPRPTDDELREIATLFRHIGSDNGLSRYLHRSISELGKTLDLSEGEQTHKVQGMRLSLRDLVSVINAATGEK